MGGVGTNLFPMAPDKLPTLKSMLTEEEFLHVQAFPSILRLIIANRFLPELGRGLQRGRKLVRVEMHRLLGNLRFQLTWDELVAQMNLHLMHSIDFLPASDWNSFVARTAPVFMTCVELFNFMTRHNLIQCEINMDLTD